MPVKKKMLANGRVRYYPEHRVNGKRVYVRGAYATRREAETALAKLKIAKSQGTYRVPDDETVEQFLDGWITRKAKAGDHRPRTSACYRSTITAFVAPVIGSMRLSDVRPRHVQAVVDRMAEGSRCTSKPATVHRRYRMLKAAFADAVKTDRLAVSPCRGIDLPKLTTERLNPPTPAEVARIIDAAAAPYRLPLTLAAWTGLRRGEVLALRWQDVNLDTGVLRVVQAASFTVVRSRSTGRSLAMGRGRFHSPRTLSMSSAKHTASRPPGGSRSVRGGGT